MHDDTRHSLKVVAWETTRRCALRCRHCRGAAQDLDYAGELSTAEGKRLIDSLAGFASPVLILTGGEPMSRTDIYDLARHASDKGLRVAMAPCGPLLTPDTVQKVVAAGVKRISLSLDGATASTHDAFRGVPGAFDAAIKGLRHARAAGLEFQINTTVTRQTLQELPALLKLAASLGAAAWDLFFLVPTGRGASLRNLALSPEESEQILTWVAGIAATAPITVKTTCAPAYARISRQKSSTPAAPGRPSGGCMAGRGFLFISHDGRVLPCGFLDVSCGNLRDSDFDIRAIVDSSPVLASLRAVDTFRGKCGVCDFRAVCGGCRARAYAHSGDFLDAEPSCPYEPRPQTDDRVRPKHSHDRR